jgi:hypothetical protein
MRSTDTPWTGGSWTVGSAGFWPAVDCGQGRMAAVQEGYMALSQDLIAFVKESLQRGLPRADVERVLLRSGWPAEQVRRALHSFSDVEFAIPVPRPVPSVSARDAFMYVVMFATLILSGYNLADLVFELINRAFPDHGAAVFSQSTLQAIRWSLSSLIVAFPVFLYVAWLVGRAIRREPTKRASKVRRQLTYVTLFMASCVLIGDFITVVYNFLGGELTVRFVLKVLTVGVIAGTAFAYYLWDLRGDEKEPET